MLNSLDDIFEDDAFGLLNAKEQSAAPKTDEDRLIDSFEEINTFFERNNREPGMSSMSEYNLHARLKGFRADDGKKRVLKPFDRFNLLGHAEPEIKSLEEILNDDNLGLLDTDGDTSIFEFKYTTRHAPRAETDFVAQRQPMKEEEFAPYEQMFRQVHRELKEGKRKFSDFVNIEKNLAVSNFYLLDGMLLFLESADLKQEVRKLRSGDRERIDGRTVTIFENGTCSNMLFRSLGKAIQKDGKLVTVPDEQAAGIFENEVKSLSEADVETGWIYILKSKTTNPQIAALPNLYKIGFSKTKVEERIKNALSEATYLFSEVEVVATYRCYNTHTKHLENLLHRFFAAACINVDIFDKTGQRYTPREWFSVSLPQIDQAIQLMFSGEIVNYRFDVHEGIIATREI